MKTTGGWSLGAGCIAVFLACGAMADDTTGELPLPDGVRPFTSSIELAYAGIDRFTFVRRADIEVPSGQRVIAEGWVMDGRARRDGGDLDWSYRLSNIGRDGIERERGSLRVRTDAWGAVREAHVVEDRWPGQPGRPPLGADSMFSEEDIAFPLCCCPRGPVRMGDVLHMPPGTMTMPSSSLPSEPMPREVEDLRLTFRAESTVAGVLDVDGRRFLVVRHTADSHSTAPGPEAFAAHRSGFTLLDTRTCMPRRTVWRTRFVFSRRESTPVSMAIWQTQTLR